MAPAVLDRLTSKKSPFGCTKIKLKQVGAVEDLREHVYKTVSRLLLATHWLPERVQQVKWDIKELDMSTGNGYVQDLISEFRQFSTKVMRNTFIKPVMFSFLSIVRLTYYKALVESRFPQYKLD